MFGETHHLKLVLNVVAAIERADVWFVVAAFRAHEISTFKALLAVLQSCSKFIAVKNAWRFGFSNACENAGRDFLELEVRSFGSA